jgi:hypothetical protein
MNRRLMTGDHHGRMAGRATLLVRAVDEILGMHTYSGHCQRPSCSWPRTGTGRTSPGNSGQLPAHHAGHAGVRLPVRNRSDRLKSPGGGPVSVTLGEVRRLVAHRITAVPSRAVS